MMFQSSILRVKRFRIIISRSSAIYQTTFAVSTSVRQDDPGVIYQSDSQEKWPLGRVKDLGQGQTIKPD